MRRQLWRVALLSIALSIVLTGCLRSANSGDLDQPQGQPLNTPTPTPSPAPTLMGQEREATVIVTQVATQVVVVTATPDPLSQEVFPQQSAPTEAANAPALDLPASELDQVAQPTTDPFGAASQQDGSNISEGQQTATAIISNATATSAALTATAIGPVQPIATNVPTQDAFGPTLAPTVAGPVVSGGNCVHQVVAGETVFRLSLRYGVSINDIATASGITNPNLIFQGDRLVIPGCGTTGVVPPPTTAPQPDGTGGTVGGATGTGGAVGSAGGITHVVQQYESLFQISMRYGVPIQTIANANGIGNINLITIGDQLIIP